MKKFFCLLICMIACLSTTAFAAVNLTDIKGTKYEDAVNKLVYFEIVNGYEDNTYKPKNSVTRAELSKMLVLAMGKESSVAAAKNKFLSFTDVLSDFWGYGYIKVASDEKLVNGYPDGTFSPQGNVTYAEATTMVLRALGYKEDVEKSELAWPNNYMVYADEKLKIFENISEFKASAPANRGDIAILIWNALRTGVCDIVGENSKGLVYGEGTPMITECLGYIYYENAEIYDIEFSDNFAKADVVLDIGKKKNPIITVTAKDALEMFGNKVNVLINNKDGKIIDLEYDDHFERIEGEISNVSETKIYLTNKRNGYKRPDSEDVLLYGVNCLEEAAEVILLLDEGSVKYCIAMGASDIKIGVVHDNNVRMNDDGDIGIKIRDIGATKGGSSYYIGNENNWPSKDDVILYYINSDDYAVIVNTIKKTNAVQLSSVTDRYVKVSRSIFYEFEDKDEYTVVILKGSRRSLADLNDIKVSNDKVTIATYNGHVYFFVYPDAVLDGLSSTIVDALDELEYAIENAYSFDEAECSQETYTILMLAVKAAEKIDHTYSITKINSSREKIEDAIEDLEPASGKTEKAIVAAKKELRELVVDEALDVIDDEDLYTDKSYTYFYSMYEDAVDVLEMLAADLEEVEEAYEALEDAIYELEERD